MATRVIFLDDEPQTSGRFKLILEKAGYEVSAPKSVQEAIKEINLNGAELVVHGSHKTETHWNLCEGIFGHYPHFPSIHIATGPESEGRHLKLKGPFHFVMRPLVPEKTFLRRVKHMVFMGRLHRENQALKKALALSRRVDDLFETTDLRVLRGQFTEFFHREYQADTVYFLSPGGFSYYLDEMWKVAHFPSGANESRASRHRLISFPMSSDAALSATLQEISERLPRKWETRREPTYLDSTGKNGKPCLIVPVSGDKTGKILGHLILVNPLLYGDLALEKTFPHLSRVIGRHMEQVTNFSDAKSLSYIDDLTDLYNQRYLRLVLDKEIHRAQRAGDCFSVLFMDIDHFKQVNDTKGHLVGSKVLVALSRILHDNIRAVDYGFRYGGDEFLLILVGTGSEQAMTVGERIRQQVESSTFDVNGVKLKVTLSIGIATFPDHAATKEQIIEIADRAMYCGKAKSRNVVYVAS
jgi:two-component system, cell cycle response regulator